MKVGKNIVIAGSITSIFGIIFHLQGQSLIGPESSFMHSNPDWIIHGTQILATGIIILCIGLATLKRK